MALKKSKAKRHHRNRSMEVDMVEYFQKRIPTKKSQVKSPPKHPQVESYTMRTRRGKNGTKEKTN